MPKDIVFSQMGEPYGLRDLWGQKCIRHSFEWQTFLISSLVSILILFRAGTLTCQWLEFNIFPTIFSCWVFLYFYFYFFKFFEIFTNWLVFILSFSFQNFFDTPENGYHSGEKVKLLSQGPHGKKELGGPEKKKKKVIFVFSGLLYALYPKHLD